MARSPERFVEPSDGSPIEQDAVDVFIEHGWLAADAKWLGPLCLDELGLRDREGTCDIRRDDDLLQIAKGGAEASGVASRDWRLLVAFARLCGVGGKSAHLSHCGNRLTSTEANPLLEVSARQRIARVFSSHGADFGRTLVSYGRWPGDYGSDEDIRRSARDYPRGEPNHVPEPFLFLQILVNDAAIDPSTVLQDRYIQAAGASYLRPDPSDLIPLRLPKRANPDLGDVGPLAPIMWMIALGPIALQAFWPAFQRCHNGRGIAAWVFGLRDLIERWLFCATGAWSDYRAGGFSLANACQPYLEELDRQARDAAWDSDLRAAWLWLTLCVYEADPTRWAGLSPEQQKLTLSAATGYLAGLRKLLATATARPLIGEERELPLRAIAAGVSPDSFPGLLPDIEALQLRSRTHLIVSTGVAGVLDDDGQLLPWESFEWEKDRLSTSLQLLYRYGGVWQGLKPMLLALRALATPVVARDLRYWVEPGRESPPEPWCVLVASPLELFHAYVGREQESDPQLATLRGQLGAYCLERLQDRWKQPERQEARQTGRQRTNNDMVERSPEWRYCLVRAVGALGINPEGKGHRALHASSQIDPDADVREAARQAYEQLRRGTGLPEGVSPRRAIMSALWWIRQAHLLGLGIQLDADGAQRTRIKELTRTKEAETR